jgi:large subunit ribosomal protein L34
LCKLTKHNHYVNNTNVMITTYQPKKRQRVRKTGFRARLKTKNGMKILKARRLKGRWSLAVSKRGY